MYMYIGKTSSELSTEYTSLVHPRYTCTCTCIFVTQEQQYYICKCIVLFVMGTYSVFHPKIFHLENFAVCSSLFVADDLCHNRIMLVHNIVKMNVFLIFVAHTNNQKYWTTKISQSMVSTFACNNVHVYPYMYTCTSIVLSWGHECTCT